MIAASLDIGSNSILLLVAEVSGNRITTLQEKFYSPRLGRDMAKTGRLSEKSMAAAEKDIDDALKICKKWGTKHIYAVATAAVREAVNGEEFCWGIEHRHGLSIEIINGTREAELTFRGAVHHLSSQGKVAVLDIGGGSTECTLGTANNPERATSVPVGAVKMTEKYGSDIDAARERAAELSSAFFDVASAAAGHHLIGVGGTITTLASVKLRLRAYDPERISHIRLSIEELDEMISVFRSLSVEEIRDLPGMEPDRADIIEAGAVIARTFITLSGHESIEVSSCGLRHGLLLTSSD